jgi:hypothetical protein
MGSSESKAKGNAKTTGKSKKTVVTSTAAKRPKKKTIKSIPDENEIRIKAQEIYHERIFKGEPGSAEDDWMKAERLLKG